jgi:histidinol dehydrogenase
MAVKHAISGRANLILTRQVHRRVAGVFLGQKHLPVSSAGAYIPGGRYPLTGSAHMTVLTAKAAVRWEMSLEPHTEADVARTMNATLGFLAAAAA